MWLWRAGDAYVLTMKNHLIVVLFFASTVSFVSKHVHGQSLSPPPINIARGKNIVATSTCGVGVSEPELFCKLATVPGRLGIYGLSCDHCDPSTPSKNHSIEYAVDGTEKWWQSPPLSRGLQFQEVNITIDLGQEYQVAYVIVKTGNAPRPGTWALEKSIDGGKTFTPWQYFATTNSECIKYFGFSSLLQSFKDDTTVTCTTAYSQVPPFEDGEIHISLVNGRPGAANFSYSQTLQEWTRATHIRVRLLKVKTLLADLLPLARKDPSVTRRYFYSIKDISVGGICMCNGHADECVQPEQDKSQFVCRCKHRTCGIKCERCCPGFVQKKWRPATADSSNECEPCNCHNHATECYYDERVAEGRRSLDINGNYEGGGVCVNCQDNTIGINCERCKPGYYNPAGVPKTSPDACRACSCDRRFSTGNCYDGDGGCECLENFSGPRCDNCSEGFYGFPNCKPCDCHPMGTSGRVCGPSGNQCPCKPKYLGAKCDQCAPGYYGFPDCRSCNCDRVGSLASDCELTTGQCRCRQMYTGRQCNQCSRGFYSFPECNVCNCDAEGTAPQMCDADTGTCICMENFAGSRCDVCNEGYYRFPECAECGCSPRGALTPKCDAFGVCECRSNYAGQRCDRCDIGFYNYPQCVKCACDLRGAAHQFCDPRTGQCTCKGSFRGINCNLCRSGFYGFPNCQACRCNPAGIRPIDGRPLGDCSLSNEGQCDCKDNVQGLECTECKDGYYFLRSNNPLGCDSCQCNMAGVIGGLRVCDKVTGQCPCKLYVSGRKCSRCKEGFYGLESRKIFGCTGCDCNVGGAYDQNCDVITGQCRCRANVVGRDCGRPASRYFYPDLLHIKAEMEDGTIPSNIGSVPGQDIPPIFLPDVSFSTDGSPARFGFDQSVFPGFSWRGYAVMSDLQRAIKVTLDIPKTTRYHMVFRYILNESSATIGEVVLTPKGGTGSKQSSRVTFPVTKVGSAQADRYQTVGDKGKQTQFMLTKGQWDLMLRFPSSNILLDYVVAVPQEYYEAYQLKDKVTKPCQVNGADSLCNQFSYLSTNKRELHTAEMESGYIITEDGREETQLFEDETVLKQLDFNDMALLNSAQTRVTADISISSTGKYVLVMQYYHPYPTTPTVNVYLRYPTGSQMGEFHLQSCNYRFGCRQVAVDSSRAVKVFSVEELQRTVVTLLARSPSPIAVDSVTAIPLEMWTLDFIAPNILCTTQGGKCIPTSYPIPKGVVKIDANGDDPDQLPPNILDPTAKPKHLEGPKIHDLVTSLPKAGRYAAIVHYYQPNHPSFDSQVTVTSDRAVDGSVKFHYCPHVSGCRSVIRNFNRSPFFDIGRNSVALQFSIPGGASTWIDYVLLVPEDLFSGDLQEDAPIPLTQEFLDTCSKNQFFIKSSDAKFCKDSAFSLTTSFNNGSLLCNCNRKGSLENGCEVFGGQCSCRPNVIGRTCSRCRTGYYGFPVCKKCSCIFCNEITGACDCPSNTVGPNCEFCLRGTYGYDPILGCQQCDCDRFGVRGVNIACDAKTGQCDCKASHTGRQCNKCAAGYYGHPVCQKCNCDARGVDERICSNDGRCFCKPGVFGPRCDKCAPGYYNLDGANPDGCTKCWCNGLSDTCYSGNQYWSKVNVMDEWELENGPSPIIKIGDTNLYASISSQRTEKDKPVYWVAPKEFLGKKISSYGGKLTYTIQYEVPEGGPDPIMTKKPDVVIQGKNGKILHYKTHLNLSPGVTTPVEVQFIEDLWVGENQTDISRDDFMKVLLDLELLKLRASYSSVVDDVTINDVSMDVAVDGRTPDAARAKSVEVCDCPVRADGSSCELCGTGYTRAADNKTCILCNCFGHSYDCDTETGQCFLCQHNTTGNNCEECEPGFYGDATMGSPLDCSLCECPLGTTSNSFATSCALNPFNALQCVCKEGYIGQNCARCADGFYGNPSVPGDYCKRCTCSGNIDLSVNGSCDSLTGQCLKCINGVTGDQCERCLDGYFGDAVVEKNCARCACNDCGTDTAVCNHSTGVCSCKPNVIGKNCDECKPYTWNFDSCLGCEDCDCGEASAGPSCDVKSGQCECLVGVTGRRCDRCRAGFFAYSPFGCKECNCPKGPENLYGFCDINTGECCKPGGDCEICPTNYILTPQGCVYCGECVGRLLNKATILDYNLTTVLKSLEQGAAGLVAENRFTDINETLQRLIPPTNKYHMTMETLSQLVGVSVRNGTALPLPLAIYPLNAKHGGQDIGPNANPAAKLVGSPPVEGPYGQSDGSLQLSGAGDSYIEIPNSGSIDVPKSMTILIWVYHEEQDGPVVDYEEFKTVNLWLNSFNQFEMRFMDRDNNGPISKAQMSTPMPPRTWNHVAATYDCSTGMARLFVNEQLEEEADIGIKQLATNTPIVRVGSISGLPNHFKGRVACLQFYDTALTVEQIGSLKSACDPASESGGFSSVDLKGTLTERVDNYEKEKDDMKETVIKLSEKALEVSSNATATKDDALALEKEIMEALNKTHGIIDFVQSIAETLKNDRANQSLLLQKAEDILEELERRNFDPANLTIIEEQELVVFSLNRAKTLLNDTITMWNQLMAANKTLDELLAKFGQILDTTASVLENATAAMVTNNVSRGYDSETPRKEAEIKKEEVEMALLKLQDILQTASTKLTNATVSLEAFNGSFPQLDELIKKVNERMANLTKLVDELNPLVVIAHRHGQDLQKQADALEKLLRDIEFANKAFNASQRYSEIAQALNESLAIAREAEEIAMDARNESRDVNDQAKTSQNVSSELNKRASDIEEKVDNELSGLLDDIKTRLAVIRGKITNVTGALFDVARNFPEFEEMSSGNQASSLKDNSTESKNTADEARQIAEDIEAKLPGLSGLKESIIATNNNISEAEEKARRAVNTSYAIREKVVIQEKRQEKIIEELDTEVVRRLTDIKEMIAGAHRLLKFTSLILSFDGNTATSPIVPPTLEQDTSFLNFLMYTKPEKPDGLLLYMGDSQKTTRQKRQSPQCGADFVALEMEASKVHFKLCTEGRFLDVMSGVDIQTDKGRWNKIEAVMSGGLANLKVSYFDDNKKEKTDSVVRSLQPRNPRIAFNTESDLIVGGIPMGRQLPPQVENVNYTGCFDGLQFNDHFVGLWNSDPLENPGSGFCLSRDGPQEFAASEDEQIYTFFGVGFIKSGIYDSDPMGEFQFSFQTTSSNGILLLGIDDDDPSLYQAVELRNGFIVYSYSMGHGLRQYKSKNFYDKGEVVSIVKEAVGRRGDKFKFLIRSPSIGMEENLVPDGTPFYPGKRSIDFVDADYVYWGGIENRTNIPENVTRKFFKGCLSKMRMVNDVIKIGKTSTGYIPGCQVKVARNATFLHSDSYLRKEPFITSRGRRGFNIGLTFRAEDEDGLLLLEAHDNDRDFIALGLLNGKVVFKANAGGSPVTLQTEESNYNDRQWHFVTTVQNGPNLHLYVDDEVISDQFGQRMQKIQTTQDMFIGGVPRDFTVRSQQFMSLIKKSLKGGAIRDLTFDEELFNFADFKKRKGVVFDLDDYSEQAPKNLIIVKPTQSTTETTTMTEEPSTTPTPTPSPSPSPSPTSSPSPKPICPMPSKPPQLSGVMGFGNDLNSHAAYIIKGNSVLQKLIGSRTKVSLEFRAVNQEGILLYSAQSPNQADFVECHLEKGRVSCSFSTGGGILKLTSKSSFNDGQWHTLRLIRKGVDATLYVDDSKVASDKASGSQQNIDGLKELYIGGTPEDFDSKRVPAGSRVSFPGCIRNVTVNKFAIGPPSTPFKIQNCYANAVERGVSFEQGGGYLLVDERYGVGVIEEITLEVKPTSQTGLLLSSSSPKQDYIVLELIGGDVVFRAENGGGELVVRYTPDNPGALCDGNWHKIHIWKKRKVVQLQVDGGDVLDGGGIGSQSSADLSDPLYVGGLPEGVVGKGVTATDKYTGCIRDLVADNIPKSLSNPIMMAGNIYLGGCPY